MPKKLLPVAALVFNAMVWGISWWPFRQLELHGLHPLWATVSVYMVATTVVLLAMPRAFCELVRTPVLWVLAFAAGATNMAFNWGVVAGDVVQVVLLFYLMPVWAALLAWILLGERPTGSTLLSLLLALAGAMIVLWPETSTAGRNWHFDLPEALGLFGGFTFALNNVMLRREGWRSEESKAAAVLSGGVVVPGLLAVALTVHGDLSFPTAPVPAWGIWVSAIAAAFLLSNLALQYGAARLPANVTAVVMLTEVIFASGSALLLGAGELTSRVMTGGSMILAAGLLSALAAMQPRADSLAAACVPGRPASRQGGAG